MQRLFWTYPDGLPGAGLLVLRCATGVAMLVRCFNSQSRDSALEPEAVRILLATVPALCLIVGRWTPFAAAVVAGIELWRAVSQPGDPWGDVLIGALGIAVALLGPGAWSADAYLFGWKHIDVSRRPNGPDAR